MVRKIEDRHINWPRLPLADIGDDPTGARQVLRPWAQTFDGLKTFRWLDVGSDPDKADDSLMNQSDFRTLMDDNTPASVTQPITLTDADVARRGVTLTGTPIAGTPVTLTLEGAGLCVAGEDIEQTGASISWAADARLCALLEAGDTVYVRWTTLRTT